MLLQNVNEFLWSASNFATPSATPGTSVTPGASNAEGAWTQVLSGATVTEDVWDLYLCIAGGNTSATAKNHLVDIGVDLAGGTSYTEFIPNILCSQSQAVTIGGCQFRFPVHIPAGASIAVRCRGSAATAGTIRALVEVYGQPNHPEYLWKGSKIVTLGAVEASSIGTAFTPGNAAWGSWVSLGTAGVMSPRFFQLGVGVNNGTITAQYSRIELGISDDEVTFYPIGRPRNLSFYGTAEIAGWVFDTGLINNFIDIDAGVYLGIRGRCSTSPATGYNATLHLVG